MSADIMSTQAPSTSARFKRGSSRASKPGQPLVDPRPQHDPARIIGIALAFARQGSSDTRAVPSVVLEPLRHLADSGDPACRLVLDYLERRVGADYRTFTRQGVSPEIVSVHPAMKEDR
jgi:hypothetical protein